MLISFSRRRNWRPCHRKIGQDATALRCLTGWLMLMTAVLAVAVAALAAPNSAEAAPLAAAASGRYPWGTAPFTYFGEQTALRTVLRDFAAQYSIRAELDPRLSGKLGAKLSAPSPEAFLDALAAGFGLDWFYAKGSLYVSRRADRIPKVLNLGVHSAADVARMLRGFGVFDERFGWTDLPRDGRLIVNGPPAYVSMVEAAIAALPSGTGAVDFGFFQLHHARVQDRIIRYRDQQITVPGAASIVARLLAAGPAAGAGATRGVTGLPAGAFRSHGMLGMQGLGGWAGGGGSRSGGGAYGGFGRAMRFDVPDGGSGADTGAGARRVPLPWSTSGPGSSGSSGSSGYDGAMTRANGASSGWHGDGSDGPGQGDVGGAPFGSIGVPDANAGERPSVVADTRLNAIIVRAPRAMLAACRALIERLDVAVPLVQIEALIVDINDGAAREFGIDWAVSAAHVSFSSEQDGAGGSARPRRDVNGGLAGALGGGLSTILPSRVDFMARIHALEQDGRARVVSRPSILTQNNAAALLDLSETFYIRNRGDRAVETIPVTAGLMLDIVPGVVDDTGPSPRVMMDIQIEDGHRIAELVEGIPVVSRSTISTQAVVRSGQSLLIAGHQVDSEDDGKHGIPGLSSIPLIGALFRGERHATRSSKRFFLITPRVIDVETPAAALPENFDLAAAMAPRATVLPVPKAVDAVPIQIGQPDQAVSVPMVPTMPTVPAVPPATDLSMGDDAANTGDGAASDDVSDAFDARATFRTESVP